MFEGVAGEYKVPAIAKQFRQRQVNRSHGAVEIDGPEQLAADLHELEQRVDAAGMNRQSLRREEAVAEEPLEIVRPLAVATHVGVAEDKIHVVDGVHAAEQTSQQHEPLRMVAGVVRFRPLDEERNLLRINPLAHTELAVRAAPHLAQQIAQFVDDDVGAEHLVRQLVGFQEMRIEEVTKRPVANIVQQRGQAAEALHIPAAWHLALARVGERCRTSRPPCGWPCASPPRRAETAYAPPTDRPTTPSAVGESAAFAGATDDRAASAPPPLQPALATRRECTHESDRGTNFRG